jgi:hypothetical protein
LLGPLLFDNNASDARDHAANERSESLKYLEALEAVLLTVYPSISLLVKAFGVYGYSFRSYCDIISSQNPAHRDRQVALIPKTT